MSDDVIRFADSQNLDRFTVMGHSMGARCAMTLACRFPDRVDGVISVDAAPKNESDIHKFGSFAETVINFMEELSREEGVTYRQATDRGKDFFKGKP